MNSNILKKSTMRVIKRNGEYQELSFDKIIYRLEKLCSDNKIGEIIENFDTSLVAQKVISTIYDGVKTSHLDEEAARIAASMSEDSKAQLLASRIIISNLHKNTFKDFYDALNDIEKANVGSIDTEILELAFTHRKEIAQEIDHSRDYYFTYFGFKTLEKGYLWGKKIDGKHIVCERPQHLYMRVALAIHRQDLENVFKTYHLLSNHYYTHASPTLFNAGSRCSNNSSCFLLGTEDSIEGIFNTYSDCAKISKLGGGIGVHVSNIRSKGSIIRGTNGRSDGIIPMLRVYNEVCKYINQCFVGDTLVYTRNGPRNIENICVGDQVVTIDGTFKQVMKVFKNDVEKEILEISSIGTIDPIRVTREHDLYVMKKGCETASFIPAANLECGDLVCFPMFANNENDDITTFLEFTQLFDSSTGTYSNSNRMLIARIKYTLYKIGVMTTCCRNDKDYTLTLSKQDLSNAMSGISGKSEMALIQDKKYWVPITSIKTVTFGGPVYDLNIRTNANYLTDLGLVHNSGRRKGSFAIYLEPWHPEIMEFLDLRKNHGTEDLRARDLFYSIWTPDIFMRQVENDGDWYLMCPDTCPGLQDAVGEDFDKLYQEYIDKEMYKKKIKARSVWYKILDSQIETGVPYIGYKDNVNKKCNQKNLGTIKSSNLCSEISLYSDENEYACCNLASIALPKFVKYNDQRVPYYDFEHLHRVASYVVVSMNRVIDVNYYPTEQTRYSDKRNRPLGIGIQGLTDCYCIMSFPFESDEAKALNIQIFETLYHATITSSIELAKRDGHYETWEKSPFSQGKLQFDLCEEYDGIDLNKYLSSRYDWNAVKQDLKTYGARNSMLTALMPTASTAQIMGNSESFEVINSCIFKRRVLSGEFVVLNKYLVKDLEKIGLWNIEMKNKIIALDGSIQAIQEIPENIRKVYKTSWEISMKSVIEQCHDRGVFIDQMQSMNMYVSNPNYNKLTSMHFYSWKSHLKTGIYYLRSKSSAVSAKFSIDATMEKELRDQIACSIENKDECVMCSS